MELNKGIQQGDLMELFNCTILCMLLDESLSQLPPEIKRQKIKSLSNQLIKELEPLLDKNYSKMFYTDEETTQDISAEYLRMIKQISSLNIPDKIGLAQILDAFQYDRHTILGTAHRIIKKHS